VTIGPQAIVPLLQRGSPIRKGGTSASASERLSRCAASRCVSGFHHLYADGAIYEVAYWDHAKCKFHDIHVADASSTTTEAMVHIVVRYGIEEEIRGKPAKLRCSVRQARAWPLLDKLRSWMQNKLRSLHQERNGRRHQMCTLTLACCDTLR
jgi:transposase